MIRLIPVAAGLASIAITGAFAILPASSQSPAATTSPSPAETSSPTATPTPKPEEPTPNIFFLPDPTPVDAPAVWTPPAGYAGALRPGVWVQIAGTDSCLNVRVMPALYQQSPEGNVDSPVLNCLPDGFIGQLSFGPNESWSQGNPVPVQADGHWWWYVLGQGWVADDWLAFVAEENGSPFPARPELAGAGLIAFVRMDGVWLASADGSSSRVVYPLETDKGGISAVRWSPDGQLIAVTRNVWDEQNGGAVTEIIDLNGTLVAEYPGLAEPNWSPDGSRLSAVRVWQPGQLGGYQATPVVIDRSTGAETAVGPGSFYLAAPAWAPDGSAVTFVCWSSAWQEYKADGSTVDHVVDCGGDGLRTVSLTDGAVNVIAPTTPDGGITYEAPAWSPDGQTISVYTRGGDCEGYALFDVASGTRLRCFALPAFSGFGGGCGGNAESGASDWSPDGRTLAYHWQFREGQNGVALVDAATGDRRMILTTGASSISFSGDGAHLTFASSGYIWTADSDSTNVARLTDGWLPEWQPVP